MKLSRFSLLPSVAIVLAIAAVSHAEYDRRTAIVEAVAKTRDAIVNIRTMKTIPARIPNQAEGRVKGLGTGVLVDPRGYVVTNHHVVEGVSDIKVLTSHNYEYSARLVNSDPKADLAILRIDAPGVNFAYLPLWGAGEPILGEMVIAIGNPYGLENSVTTGIVSSINRRLKLPNEEVFDDLIQTDASINPGNSGGPLLTVNGDLLGVNVAIRSHAQGIGFAIPTRKVREVVRKMMRTAPASITKQGLFVRDLNPQKIDETIGRITQVVSVDRVEPGSAAEEVGFRPGDQIVAVENQSIGSRFDLERVLWGRNQGDLVTFRVRRDGSDKELKLAFIPYKELDDLAQYIRDSVGIVTEKVAAAKVRQVYDPLNGGLIITEVVKNSPADLAGLRVGDILVGLHDYETLKISDIRFVMKQKYLPRKDGLVDIHFIRDGVLEMKSINLPQINDT